MQRTQACFTISNTHVFKHQLLQWAQSFEEVVWLDSNEYQHSYSSYEAVLAVGALTALKTDYFHAFDALKEYRNHTKDWLFGYLSYDLKNDTESLTSSNIDDVEFPDLYFFQPQKLILIKENKVTFSYLPMVDDEIYDDFSAINSLVGMEIKSHPPLTIKKRMDEDTYLQQIAALKSHIYRGDVYEANFCQEFYATEATIDPINTYHKFNDISRPPFASFLKLENKFALSASPERFLKRNGTHVVSQPIKGTARRAENMEEDEGLKEALRTGEKERSENIMIVDLVRNDLSHYASKGSVIVEELCKIYTFEQVHQMISTITASVALEIDSVDLIKSVFPMGSMTGAPKIAAMQLIEKLESTKRGLYSGAIGYFAPNGDFDFNVVIRSILYNAEKQFVSFSVGSAITARSVPEKEYEECLLKAKAMRTVLV